MVSPQLYEKPFLMNPLILPIIESDFSDVFGPVASLQASNELCSEKSIKTFNEVEDSLEEFKEEKSNEQLNDMCLKHENEIVYVGVEDFEVLKLVGQGSFGKVYQVRKKGTSDIYAMKVMRKDKIIQRNCIEDVKSEVDILKKVNHPFIVRLRCAFHVILFCLIMFLPKLFFTLAAEL